MKKILVILGHPSIKSLSKKIADEYIREAKSCGANVKTIFLPKLKFDPILHEGYKKKQKLEKDLQKAQKLIKWAEHIVWIYPLWWREVPALLKGFIERVFLPDFAFKYKKHSWDMLLKGRTSRQIVTAGGPRVLYTFASRHYHTTITDTMEFCGIFPVKKTLFSSIRKIDKKRLNKILKDVRKVARRDCE